IFLSPPAGSILYYFFTSWRGKVAYDTLLRHVRKVFGSSTAARGHVRLSKRCRYHTRDLNMHDQQVAVVTGASSGIGRAIALAIAATGASVCLVGRNRDRLAAVAAVARKTAYSVMVHEADLTSDSAVESLTRSIEEDFKTVDILVHCAGAYAKGELESTPVEQLDALYRANVRMPYAVTQALLPFLKIRQGQIVFVNSSQGLNA